MTSISPKELVSWAQKREQTLIEAAKSHQKWSQDDTAVSKDAPEWMKLTNLKLHSHGRENKATGIKTNAEMEGRVASKGGSKKIDDTAVSSDAPTWFKLGVVSVIGDRATAQEGPGLGTDIESKRGKFSDTAVSKEAPSFMHLPGIEQLNPQVEEIEPTVGRVDDATYDDTAVSKEAPEWFKTTNVKQVEADETAPLSSYRAYGARVEKPYTSKSPPARSQSSAPKSPSLSDREPSSGRGNASKQASPSASPQAVSASPKEKPETLKKKKSNIPQHRILGLPVKPKYVRRTNVELGTTIGGEKYVEKLPSEEYDENVAIYEQQGVYGVHPFHAMRMKTPPTVAPHRYTIADTAVGKTTPAWFQGPYTQVVDPDNFLGMEGKKPKGIKSEVVLDNDKVLSDTSISLGCPEWMHIPRISNLPNYKTKYESSIASLKPKKKHKDIQATMTSKEAPTYFNIDYSSRAKRSSTQSQMENSFVTSMPFHLPTSYSVGAGTRHGRHSAAELRAPLPGSSSDYKKPAAPFRTNSVSHKMFASTVS